MVVIGKPDQNPGGLSQNNWIREGTLGVREGSELGSKVKAFRTGGRPEE